MALAESDRPPGTPGVPLISENLGNYFRDVYDHTIIAIDTVETYRDILSGMLDIYLSSMSNRLNRS